MTEKRILIIDDSEEVRTTLRLTLEFKGYCVTEASDGSDGLNSLRNGSYDLVFCDLAMPGMQGNDVVRAIRGELGLEDLPVIILSAEEREAKMQALESGATDCVDKPFMPRNILSLVEKTIGG